jgi:hypothetical protein
MPDFSALIRSMNRAPTEGMLIGLGAVVSNRYRQKYGRGPEKTSRTLSGGLHKRVNIYKAEEGVWIRPMVQEYLATH